MEIFRKKTPTAFDLPPVSLLLPSTFVPSSLPSRAPIFRSFFLLSNPPRLALCTRWNFISTTNDEDDDGDDLVATAWRKPLLECGIQTGKFSYGNPFPGSGKNGAWHALHRDAIYRVATSLCHVPRSVFTGSNRAV